MIRPQSFRVPHDLRNITEALRADRSTGELQNFPQHSACSCGLRQGAEGPRPGLCAGRAEEKLEHEADGMGGDLSQKEGQSSLRGDHSSKSNNAAFLLQNKKRELD